MTTTEKKSSRTGGNRSESNEKAFHGTFSPHQDTASRPSMGAPTRHPDSLADLHLLRDVLADWERAVALLRAADPVACELYEMGYRLGIEEGERRAGERADAAANGFIHYLAGDDDSTPRSIPPLENEWRAAA